MKTFSITLGSLEMFTGIVGEITTMFPSAYTCVGAKGFRTGRTGERDQETEDLENLFQLRSNQVKIKTNDANHPTVYLYQS